MRTGRSSSGADRLLMLANPRWRYLRRRCGERQRGSHQVFPWSELCIGNRQTRPADFTARSIGTSRGDARTNDEHHAIRVLELQAGNPRTLRVLASCLQETARFRAE
jgi:hypothetical protein